MKLPTLENGNIDPEEVKQASLIIMNGIKTIAVLVNGTMLFFTATQELLNWFKSSGIPIDDKTQPEDVYEFTQEDIQDSKRDPGLQCK